MSERWSVRLGILLLLSVLAVPVLAQSNTTSALTGVVTGSDGGALPGASVRIESPSLLGGSRTAATDGSGHFRFPELTPGLYAVSVSVQGFQTLRRQGVVLSLGRTTNLPIQLSLESLKETLVVVGEAPTLDPTSSATTTSLNNDLLQNLPTTRFQPDVLNLAPGINLSSAYGGGSSSANAYQIDGVDVSDPEGGTPWAFFNYNLIQEAELVGLGAPAEYGQFTGVVFNSITRSGGNQIKGLVETLYSGQSLTSSNSNIANLDPTTKRLNDSTIQMGGPFIKDKLWYFISGQYNANDTTNGGPLQTERDPRIFAKADWQLTQSSTMGGWLEWDKYDITGRGGNAVTPLEATVREKAPEVVWNFSEHTVLSPDTLFSLADAGYNGYYYLIPEKGLNVAGHEDALTQTFSQNSIYFYDANRTRHQLNASLSHHATDFIKGSHDFKFGMEVERSTVKNRYGYTTGTWFYDNVGMDYDPRTGQLAPYSLAYSGNSYTVHATSKRVSAYAQDTWRVGSRLTINPGVRADFNRGNVSSGQVFATNPVAPRLGLTWDVLGDGKTLVKAHYGRYYEAIFAAYYYWADPNAFHGGQIDEVFPSGAVVPVSETAGGRYAVDKHIRQPYLDQVILGLDRELGGGLTFSGTLVYRKNNDLIETVSRDGIFVPVTGTVPETGKQVTLYDYLNPGEDTLIATNPNGLFRSYKGAILTLTKRLKDNWQMMFSYVYSQSRGNIDNLDGLNSAYGGNAPGRFLDTPNSLVNAEGTLTHDQTHQVKLQGTYIIQPINVFLSGNYTYHSGDTWNRRDSCLLVDDGAGGLECHDFPQGTVRYFAEPRGSRRLPARNQIDLRGEWGPPILGGRLGVILDLFNVTNQGRATVVEDRTGGNFGQALSFSDPRQYRLGLRYVF